MTILPIPRDCVAFAWNDLRKYVESACSYTGGAETHRKLRSLCMNDPSHKLYALVDNSTIKGCLIVDASSEAVHLTTVAGEMQRGWQYQVFDLLKGLAIKSGARRITCKGRKGWQRFLKPLGFVPADNGYLEVIL